MEFEADSSSLELFLLAVAPPFLLLLSCSWPETDCTLCNPRRLAQCLSGMDLPASSEGPLSSAVVAKPKDGDYGGGGAGLLRKIALSKSIIIMGKMVDPGLVV